MSKVGWRGLNREWKFECGLVKGRSGRQGEKT